MKHHLLTCPGCGKGGFINLKSHRCRPGLPTGRSVAIDLVPPPESIEEIEEHLTPVLGKVQRKTEDLLYDMVHVGLYLMKAQVAHRCITCDTGSDGKFVGSEDGGFRAWLDAKFPQISRMTAYRYINGAKNCGLAIGDGAEAIETLRSAHALAGKTAGDLYRLVAPNDQNSGGTGEGEQLTFNLVRDTATSLREQCEAVLQLRDRLDKKAFSTVCARIHRTLEDLTGQPWGPASDRPAEPFFREHGDIYELGC